MVVSDKHGFFTTCWEAHFLPTLLSMLGSRECGGVAVPKARRLAVTSSWGCATTALQVGGASRV